MIERAYHAILAFVQAHGQWAPLIVCAVTFVKSLAFVSLVVPGITLMLAIGGLVGAAGLDFWPILGAVVLGAGLGDWASYEIGLRVQHRVGGLWPFTRYPGLVERGEAFFVRWGAMSVVLCRFVGPLRATVPLLCGVFAMSAWRFQLANWPSAVLWALTLLGPGQVVARWLH